MKKHLIAALVGVMILAVTAPAIAAANAGGNLDIGYGYDFQSENHEASNEWGLNVNGKISQDVSFMVGFGSYDGGLDAIEDFAPSEAWIQAENTPVGTVKLGAFDQEFGRLNEADWLADEISPLNVQISNEFGGINLMGGVQFRLTSPNADPADDNGIAEINAIGATAGMEITEGLAAKVGVMSTNDGSDWSDARFGYEVAYTGMESLALGLKGNTEADPASGYTDAEIVGVAEYEVMPGIVVNAMYGQNTENPAVDGQYEQELMKAGVKAQLLENLTTSASYEIATDSVDVEHNVIRLGADYGWELADGLTVTLEGDYVDDDRATEAETSVGASVGIAF